jgi:hypothetical protein
MTSVSIIIIEKGGNVKELKVKSYDENELYKKGGFKASTDFKLQSVWKNIKLKNMTYNIHIYGKLVGRANQENKYEFPPPIDNTLFFGSCVLVNKVNNIPINLTSSEWNSIYNHLYGGFDDLDEGDSEDSEDEDEDEDLPKTKSGYVKDDFIVDDDFDDESESESSTQNKRKRNIPPKTPRRQANAPTVFNISDTEDSDYTNELEEEEYL